MRGRHIIPDGYDDYDGPDNVDATTVNVAEVAAFRGYGSRKYQPDCETCALRRACIASVRRCGVFADPDCELATVPSTTSYGKSGIVLDALRAHPGVTAAELCRITGMGYKMVSNALVNLRRRNLLISETDAVRVYTRPGAPYCRYWVRG